MAYKISFQLYSSRNFPPQQAVLDELKAIGYDAVEPYLPDYGSDPKGFRQRLDDAGLECLGFHMPFKGLIEETQRYIDIALTLGRAPLMIPPFLPMADRPSDAAGWQRVGEQLGRGAVAAAAAGLRVAWHNHEFEYKPLPDGSRPVDLMFAAAGDAVGFEIDLAWVMRAWADPATELRRHAERILAIQVKDTAPPGTRVDGGWTAPGDGMIDWEEVWPLLATTPADQLVVEHDNPSDWRALAQRAYDFLIARGARS